MALSIFVPIAYIVTLFLSLALFSKVYRSRTGQRFKSFQLASSAEAASQPDRAIYQALAAAQQDIPSEEPADSEAWVVPRATLQAALVARAVAALRRLTVLRSDKQALSSLLERGSVGDDAAVMLEAMESEVRGEVLDIVNEAGRFSPSWSKVIFQTAGEISANLRCRDALLEIMEQREEEGM